MQITKSGHLPVRIAITAALLAILVLSGCGGLRSQYQEKRTFRLSTAPEAAQAHATGQGLWVKRLDISSEFRDTSLTYRINTNEYVSDYHNNYMVPPARMITDLIAENLYGSEFFSPVSRTSTDDIKYLLWGKILALYADIRDSSAPRAVVSIRLCLDRQTDRAFAPVIRQTYTQTIPLTAPSPEAYIDGVNQGLTRILDDFFTEFQTKKDEQP